MSTRNNKGSVLKQKVEQSPNEESREEKINRLVEKQAAITDEKEEKFLESSVEEIEVQPVDEECICDENCTCESETNAEIDKAVEEFKKLPDVQPESIKETLEKFHNIDAEAEMTKLLEASADPLKFQKDYFLINDGKSMTTSIDTPPEEPVKAPEVQERKRKTFAQMTATEMNIYHKTGIIPFC